jgi:hypothetical protein
MNIKEVAITAIANLVCAIGGSVAVIGAFFSIWFFFVSNSVNRFFWGGGGVLLVFLGYLLYRAAFPYIRKEWNNHY